MSTNKYEGTNKKGWTNVSVYDDVKNIVPSSKGEPFIMELREIPSMLRGSVHFVASYRYFLVDSV